MRRSGRARPGASPHTRGWTAAVAKAEAARNGFPAHAGMDPTRSRGPRRRHGLPRTRGDGPRRRAAASPLREASPHTRGWTRTPPLASRWPAGFPAHAGMDPLTRRRRFPRSRLPRTRGDGPAGGRHRPAHDAASPHTRGWTRADSLLDLHRRGFPAHAGMDPGCRHPQPFEFRLPRTRGDGPLSEFLAQIASSASPHTRGWTFSGAGAGVFSWGFPAHAGMDRCWTSSWRPSKRLPRTRGDGPALLDP